MIDFLFKIKLNALTMLQDNETLVVESLYKSVEGEDGEITQEPITDVEGTTALLKTDGTSWIFLNNEWVQIDANLDYKILCSIYPFIMSVNNSINNNFVILSKSKIYNNLQFKQNEENSDFVDIEGFDSDILVQAGDFIFIKTCTNIYLSYVQSVSANSITVDNRGLNIRITGVAEEYMFLGLVSFPADYLDAVLSMMAYDFYQRDSKEKRQERLGSYTYINFEPERYYGNGSYPKYLQDTVSYWQKIFI